MPEELLPKPELDLPLTDKELDTKATVDKEKAPKESLHLIRSFLLGFLFIGIIIGIMGAYFVHRQNTLVYKMTMDQLTPDPTKIPDITENWQTYTNTKFGFSLKYPKNLNTNCKNDSDDCSINGYVSPIGSPDNFIWFTAIPINPKDRKSSYYNDNVIDLFLKQDNNSVNTHPAGPANIAKFFTLNRINNVSIDNVDAMVFENKHPWESKTGTIEKRIIFTKNGYIYTIGAFTESNDISLKLFNQIVSTFKFTNISPIPTCRPRPSCLDSNPKCYVTETDDMCPPSQ